MLDPQGRVASWNTGAQRIKGYSAREIVGQHFRTFYPPEQQESGHPEEELEAALRDGRYEEDGWRIRKDGSRFWANVLITAVFDDSGTHIGFAKVTRDTTERRQAEQERAATNEALATANLELESLADRLRQAAEDQQRFLAMTAHELRSPLTVLGGSADTLARHWAELSDPERLTLLDGMSSSAKRLQRLLSDLLAASRLDANTLEIVSAPVAIADVLQTVVDAVRTGEPGADISVSVRGDIRVVADAGRLEQALDNLVRNALSHGASPVQVTVERAGAMAQIRVTDAGDGVDPALVPRLFQRFATGDRVDGTGLGLFISRELAKAQGGDAVYEPQSPEQPAGSFVITIPLAG
jgi:PAS domain S-box-containing protein